MKPLRSRSRFLAAAVVLPQVAFALEQAPPPPRPAAAKSARVSRAPFGQTPGGEAVEGFTLTNKNGVEVRLITWGAIVVSIRTPDRAGKIDDITLGFDGLEGYLENKAYFGAVVGRYANRIALGKFTLDGKTYTLATNDGANHLHGGRKGWDKAVWGAESFERADAAGVVFTHTSPDGDEGYPGTVAARVTYTLTDANELVIDYRATSDKATPINLTNHTYFNLAGAGTRPILEHELTLNASRYTAIDAGAIPTGELPPVEGTPFDFRKPRPVGMSIDADNPQIKNGKGYDHNWVIDRTAPGLVLAAHVTEPTTHRTLDVSTTEPGVQFYTGNYLDGTLVGKGNRPYKRRTGFCLETQKFPDSPNHPTFPSSFLRPGEEYRSTTVFKFGVAK